MYGSKYIGIFLYLSFTISVPSNGSIPWDSNKTKEKMQISDGINCPTSISKIIHLVNIESSDCDNRCDNECDILSKKTNKLFFIESSGREYLTPRYACAIESAVKNTELSGHIIIVMTSPYLDISSNNATCHLYERYAGKQIFFRYANLDTIFEGTPIHQIHLDGHLKHHEEIITAVQYR